MPQGPPTILSPAVFTQLYQQISEHPRIRKHQACLRVIKYYLLQPHSDTTLNNLSINRTPHQVTIFCDSYNCNFLNHNTDSKISAKCIWRIIHHRLNTHTHHRTEIVVRKLVIQAYDQLKTNIYL